MMALLRRGHQLVFSLARQSGIRYFRSSSVLLTGTQSEFTGLENCFIWDEKHGFGFNKDGEVVIVTPNTFPANGPVFNSQDLNITGTSPDLMEQDPEVSDYDGESYAT
ncbi:uncharacterized protein LOC144632654 [Oculina patagonica]